MHKKMTVELLILFVYIRYKLSRHFLGLVNQ